MTKLKYTFAGALLGFGLMSAHAAPVDMTGYFRVGAGTSTEGGKETCFRLPGAIVWFRLGNECDLYASLDFNIRLGDVDGTTFKAVTNIAYGTQQMANWEQSAPAWRQLYVEASDIGAAMNMPALRGASLWAGKRFYKNPDIHMLDYTYWEPAQGPGAGLDGVDVGVGKLSYAVFRIGDFTGYGINGSLSGFNPDIVAGGNRTATVHDLRLDKLAVNPGGQLTVGMDLIRKSNSEPGTYTTQSWQSVDLDNDPATPNVDVLVRETHELPDTGRNGIGFTLTHRQTDFLGLGGFHDLGFQYAHNAAALKGFGFAGSNDKRDEWMLFNHWAMEPKGSSWTATATAGYRHADINDKQVKEMWVGARPQYHLNNVWSLMSEVGYQQVKVEGEPQARKLAKVTLGTQFSMGRSIFARPAIRFYTTYAKWNDAAAAAGSVACTGRDCNTSVGNFADKREGLSYGVQVETWF